MINPLNELSEVYKNSIFEIHKQAHAPHEVPSKNLHHLVKKAVKRIDTDVDGDTDHNDKAKGELGEFIPGVNNKRLHSSTHVKTARESYYDPMEDDDFDHDEAERNRGVSGKNNPKGGKTLAKNKKIRKESYSNWRDDLRHNLREVVVDDTDQDLKGVDPKKEVSMTDKESEKEIKDKKVKNKIVINPLMKEAVEELGGELIGIEEVLDMKKADMGTVIKDFRKSDAPQFKGKSKAKKTQMAIAAKLTAERGGRKLGEGMETVEGPENKEAEAEKKKLQVQKIKELRMRMSAAKKGVY